MDDSDKIVELINLNLRDLEKKMIDELGKSEYPLIFIVGVPRSGTTLLLQMLITYFQIGYINNFIAKFWEAPFLGINLYRSIKKNHKIGIDYKSNFGFTKEFDGPHEFGYFWKRWFKYNETHQLEAFDHEKIDKNLLKREINAVKLAWQAPVVFKNPAALSLQIDLLSKIFPESYFLYIKRDSFYNAQSLYLNRIKYYGSAKEWFSTKPREFIQLKDKDVYDQIAGQVYYVTKKIEEDLDKIPNNRKFYINYEDLTLTSNQILNDVEVFLSKKNELKKIGSSVELNFTDTNQIRVEPKIEKELKKALMSYNLK